MKRKLAGLGLILVLLLSTVSFVSADSAGFTTERFDVDVTISEDHVMSVKETIDADFYESRHGIFRYIPYDSRTYKIKNETVYDDPYEVYMEDGNVVLQIGDPDETIRGKHTYQLSYDLVCYEDTDEAVDYLSIDLLPPEWQTAIEAAKITVHFPKAIDSQSIQIFSGIYGTEGNTVKVQPKFSDDGKTMTMSVSDMERGQGITLSAELPEGYWVGEVTRDWMIKPLKAILFLVPILTALLWFIFGRDPKLVKPVEFHAPEGMTPAEIGYVVDGVVHNKDLSAMIVYFAEKGYLEIKEYDEDKFQLTKLKSIDQNEKRFAKTIFNAFFSNGDNVKMNNLPEDLGDYYDVAKQQISGLFRGENRLYTLPSVICRVLSCVLYVVLAVVPVILAAMMTFNVDIGILFAPMALIGLIGMILLIQGYDNWNSMRKGSKLACVIVGGIFITLNHLVNGIFLIALLGKLWIGAVGFIALMITIVFVVLMNARTKKATELVGRVLGFRNFIETAELDKLKLMVEENPNYFYDIMPYAYVFGLSNTWIKHFEEIPIGKPRWYVGHSHVDVWDAYWYSRMMNRCMTSMDHSISSVVHATKDDGGGEIGGGFGGGGFVGGGFGGGGGGSW